MVLLVVLMAGAANGAAAQELSYGVKGGVTFATLSFDPSSEISYDLRTGIVAGGFVAFPLGSRLAIQPEGLFAQKGAKAEDLGVSVTIKIDYVEVPVLVKYRIAGGSARSFHLFGGPSVAFKVKSSSSAEFEGSTVEVGNDADIETVDYGVLFGAGMDAGRFTIDGRFTFGLANINTESDEPKAHTRAIAVLAGVRF
ncbi:MAG TPA: porin family protein [Vicinamibacterales bacterium]|nr:porin family protein [Vicinamibacterales bacterium]